MEDLTLVILAAGMGSRFGGLKQIEPVGPNGEFIIDYSIYDAKKAGFKKVVFIIKQENYQLFKETIGKRIENKIDVSYAFQEFTFLPNGYKFPNDRVKPLGTAHAILCAKDFVKGSFTIINADDFYGYDSYKIVADYLINKSNLKKEQFCMAGYKIANTLTENGSVKRGVCEEKDGYLSKIIESKVEKINNQIIVNPLDGSKEFKVADDSLVSMNMFGFTNKIFEFIEDGFNDFINDSKNNLLTSEYLIPNVVFNSIIDGKATVKVLKTKEKWYGVTYKEDKDEVVNAIQEMIKKNIYPQNLWK